MYFYILLDYLCLLGSFGSYRAQCMGYKALKRIKKAQKAIRSRDMDLDLWSKIAQRIEKGHIGPKNGSIYVLYYITGQGLTKLPKSKYFNF